MILININAVRLLNQRITKSEFQTVKDVVRWMGAMQAQDYPMAKMAVGIRLPGSTETEIQAAIDRGEILRTHLLRPTWHFVAADDIHWILQLTAPQIKKSMKFREKWLGLTIAIVKKSNRVMEKALSPDSHLTREELIAELNKAGIRTDEYRSGHLLMRAELDGLICSGSVRGAKHTYALLEKRVPKKRTMTREESLKELAQRYFCSRAPATLHDFARWSGLSMADAKDALEIIQPEFVPETIDSKTYWLPDVLSSPKKGESGFLSSPHPQKRTSVFLLPAFDEFLIAYKDRSAALDRVIEKKLISNNGLFRPTIVIDGKVSGVWKRTIEDDTLVIGTTLFRAHTRKEKTAINEGAERLGEFLGVKSVDCRI